MSDAETEHERMDRLKVDDVARCPKSFTYEGWAEAFTIFAKCAPEVSHGVCAEHDEVLAGPDSEYVSNEDILRLAALGWHANTEGGFRKFT